MVRNTFIVLLISSIFTVCSHKKEEFSEQGVLWLLLGLSDRAENYDRDVEILTHTSPPPYGNLSLDLNYSNGDIDYYIPLLKEQIAKYPRGYWIKARTKRVYLAKYILFVGGGAAKGFATAFIDNSIMLAINGIATCNCDNERVSTIHHELMHNVDFVSDGGTIRLRSPDWESLNSPGFKYGTLTSNAQWTDLIHPLPGFVSYYSTTHVSEDRAVIASAIFGDSALYANLLNWCSTDVYLAQKVRKLASDMKAFWPFAVGENTFWKQRISDVAERCR
ncbi:hypothetical protein M9Y82_03355 [Leptospira weilii]|uniref:LIC13305 family lipoprotein n=1 Tax=Leptospira weilii TaxID=28184 RepID=UPI00037DF894|nr:hypothetical protein [Leptospira weilii]MCL8265702.1 hypothetical protein [Leptospira weilii]MDL5245195.1 hypothetical protein [Leptospira weilii]OMI19188.1 hypothetical protein BUQ74_01525 [Leptospira weilii serovar Heyan]